ncbi:hypothetical protein NEUTE2DRAFT_166231 [Neurospora tetrasperma FGSC 2509]|nr:hypothetical protein NEUTE2DRAFT_166231 [Neurospora tetrasperma FGSC 2509]
MELKIPRTGANLPEYKALQEEKDIATQIKAYTVRYHQRNWGDRTATFIMMFANLVLLRFRDPHCQRGPWE